METMKFNLDTPHPNPAPEQRTPLRLGTEDLAAIVYEHGVWASSSGLQGRRADLRGADLTSQNLSNIDLSGADLRHADLSGSYLASANLKGADLAGANLEGAVLRRADLSGTYLTGANLARADLSEANMVFARLTSADLTGAKVLGARMSHADLEGAVTNGCDLGAAHVGTALCTPTRPQPSIVAGGERPPRPSGEGDVGSPASERKAYSAAALGRARVADARERGRSL